MLYSDYIIETLRLNYIDHYFLVTGGAIAPFVDRLSKHNVKYFCFQHEQSAAMAAEGYYRSSGRIACVVTTSGPGVQNILNGLCGCWYDSIPAIFISGQVNNKEGLKSLKNSNPRQAGFQEMPVVESFKHFTKESVKIDNIMSINYILETLFTPRFGPVLLDIPVDIQMTECDLEIIPTKVTLDTSTNKFIINLKDKNRPLILIGAGVKLSKTAKECMNFIEKYNIPFVLSWGAVDICETNHPLNFGSHGVYGDRVANFAVQNCDHMIIIGSRLDSRQTGGNFKSFSKFSSKTIIDIDVEEVNKLDDRGINIEQKIITPLENFFENVSIVDNSDYYEWSNTLRELSNNVVECGRDTGVYKVLDNLIETFEDDAIIIPDTGGNLVWTMQTRKLKKDQQLFTNFGNSSMGFALPCAIGAAIATNKPIICIEGDGGFQMNIQELLTVSKHNLNIKIYILNNSGYGIIKQFQDSYLKSNYTATTKEDVFGMDIDFEQISRCYGVNTLWNIKIPEDQKIYPKLEHGNSLENMSPYLDMSKYMYIKPNDYISVREWT